MGLLDSIGGLMGGEQHGSDLVGQVRALLTSERGGGLAGLASQFSNAGLGDIFSSWISTGQNLPVSAEQITQALGQPQVAALASSAGVPAGQAAAKLAQLLPGLVDQLTPDGIVPSGASLHSQATSLLGRLSSNG